MTKRMTLQRLRDLVCPDCGARQSELHQRNCLQERCRKCGGQSAICGCRGKGTLPRRPFIAWANVCAMCGGLNPELFDVPDDVWDFYVEHYYRDRLVRLACWHFITHRTDGAAYAKQHGRALLLWSRPWRLRHKVPMDQPSPFDGSIIGDLTDERTT